MYSEYIKELKIYKSDELRKILNFDSESKEFKNCLVELKKLRILRSVNKPVHKDDDFSELAELDFYDEIDPDENNSGDYVFTYVGIVIVSGRVLKCYPKYFSENESNAMELEQLNLDLRQIEIALNHIDDAKLKGDKLKEQNEKLQRKKELYKDVEKKFKQVIRVLRKYEKTLTQDTHFFVGMNSKWSSNLLSTMLFLLNDYYEFGLYSNIKKTIDYNGSGEIIWGRTINDTVPLVYNNQSYYTDLVTRKKRYDENDYFKRLHECVLSEISNNLQQADLLDIFEIPGVSLSEETLEYFGDSDAIIYQIDKELNKQFNTRKRLVLEAIRDYIQSRNSYSEAGGLTMYGVKRFEYVWEKVCSTIFSNKLDKTILQLKLKLPELENNPNNYSKKLIDCIDKPYWDSFRRSNDTLRPDIICISDEDKKFIILDAKYYTPNYELADDANTKLPGVEDVTKQYLYQLAYWPIISANGFKYVRNCFLMPADNPKGMYNGTVSMKMFSRFTGDDHFQFENIKVRFLQADACFSCYLEDKAMGLEYLDLDA